jgi:hypothetical protein
LVPVAIQDATTSFISFLIITSCPRHKVAKTFFITPLHDHQDLVYQPPLFLNLVVAYIGEHSTVQFIESQLHLAFITHYQIFIRASATPKKHKV